MSRDHPPFGAAGVTVDEPVEAAPPVIERTGPWSLEREPLPRRHKLLFVAIVLFAAVTHMARISDPTRVLPASDDQCEQVPARGPICYELIPLDERHYVPDARDVLAYGTDSDERIADGEGESGPYVVHPPVGKWFIAAGIAIFGDRPLGWRFFGGLFGVAGVAVMILLTLRLTRNAWAAAAAGLLLSVDGLWFVLSRVAMLDIYAATFLLAGVWLLVEDRDRAGPAHVGARWWRLGAGAAFGLALATKWSVIPFVAVAGAFALAWETGKAIAALPESTWWRRTFSLFGALVLLPLTLYVATYTPWLMNERRYVPPACEDTTNRFSGLACYHVEMLNFHRGLEKYETETDDDGKQTIKPAHPYFGHGWTWPFIGRPVAHAYHETGEGPRRATQHVVGLPNPVTWALGFLAIPVLGLMTFFRDRRAGFLLAMMLAGWVPFLLADLIDRPVFLFYATPMVPFMTAGLVYVGQRTLESLPWMRWSALTVIGVAMLAFAFFYPVLAALPIPHEGWFGWTWRMWLTSDCLRDDVIKKLCWI